MSIVGRPSWPHFGVKFGDVSNRPRADCHHRGIAMEWIVRLECRDQNRVLHERDIARIERPTDILRPDELGLSLLDAKALLRSIQSNLVKDQVAIQAAARRVCPVCGRNRRIKDYRERLLRSLFGEILIRCPRYVGCECRETKTRAEWPLQGAMPNRHTPEFVYLLAKLGSAMPIGRRLRCCENSCH